VLEPAGPVTEIPTPEPVIAQRLQLAIPFASPQAPPTGNFYAAEGYSDLIGVHYDGKAEFFQAQMPPGDYLLTYTTDLGQFYIVFTATENALLTIGLMDDDVVYEAMLYRGTVTDKSYTYYDDPVIVYSQFGSHNDWWTLFARDNSPGIMLIGGVLLEYNPGVSLKLTLPKPGRYVLDYRTTLGSFQAEFQATSRQQEWIVYLQPGDEILEAYLTVYE
jgi:hypothetical protein